MQTAATASSFFFSSPESRNTPCPVESSLSHKAGKVEPPSVRSCRHVLTFILLCSAFHCVPSHWLFPVLWMIANAYFNYKSDAMFSSMTDNALTFFFFSLDCHTEIKQTGWLVITIRLIFNNRKSLKIILLDVVWIVRSGRDYGIRTPFR